MSELKNPVLVVVDMQNGFLGEKSHHVIPNVKNLVLECMNRSIPVVFTRFHNRANSPYETLIGWKRLRESPEIDISDELSEYATTVIDKDFYSSFTDDFGKLIRENNWQTLIICGVATESCVLKTAVDAFEKGLIPIVVSDACASHAGNEIHEAGLTILRRFIGNNQVVQQRSLFEGQREIGTAQL